MRITLVRWIRTGVLTTVMVAALIPVARAANASDIIVVGKAGISYQTLAGDTLSSIASRLTTAASNATALGKLNGINKDTALRIGTVIQIPATLLTDEPAEAQVISVFGTVHGTGADSKKVRLKIGDRVVEGLDLETADNSFVSLLLPDASRISLPSNSHVKLTKLRLTRFTKSPRTEISIVHGKLESNVSPLEPNLGRFEVRTLRAVAAVRGTHFRVGVLPNGDTATELLSGSVVVTPTAAVGQTILHAGEGTVVGRHGIGKTVTLLAAPQLAQPVTLESTTAAKITLIALPDVRAYHVQIADAATSDAPFAEVRSARPQVVLEGAHTGDFVLHLAAIDGAGIEGQSRTVPIHLDAASATAAPAEGPSAPFLDEADQRHFHLKWHSAPASGFNLQVARDAAFSWLQFNASASGPELALPRPPFGTYYARVRVQQADGTVGPFSASQSFVVTDQWIIPDGDPVATLPNASR